MPKKRVQQTSVCILCGVSLWGDIEMCPHHVGGYSEHWAVENKTACDFFHRGVEPPVVPDRKRSIIYDWTLTYYESEA